MLRSPDLDQDYGNARAGWSTSGVGDEWDVATADGLSDAAR
jgi:hypothetical protein